MKVLFFQWHSFMNKGIENAFRKLDISYEIFFWQFEDWEKDEAFVQKFCSKIKSEDYNVVFSVNYAPLVSQICEGEKIPYVAWIYDSPLHIRNLSSLKNSCNQLYFFDRGQAEEYKKMGANALHMPLAVDTTVFGQVIQAGNKKLYETEVSLVGKLYQTQYAYYTEYLSQYRKGYLEGIISAQSKIYGGYLIPELITGKLIDEINEDYRINGFNFEMGNRELEFMLACETTGRERYTALILLARRCLVDLYSSDEENNLPGVNLKGYVDYYTQMPMVFSQSKVNLNISLKTVRTGIPLRVIDVMGCGGFVLTNYQEEIGEYFAMGEECAVYESMEDLCEKAIYYLDHEQERQQIARAGYERVKRDFTFEDRIQRMFEGIR